MERDVTPLADFDGVLNEILTTKLSRKKLIDILSRTSYILKKLGSFQSMSTKSKDTILTEARQTINIFNRQYNQIMRTKSLEIFKSDYEKLAQAINKIMGKNITSPNWDKLNRELMSEKFDSLNYYMNRSVFMLDRRVTLFEREGKQELQQAVINKIVSDRGNKTQGQLLDDLMVMLDKEYPAGYMQVPIVRKNKLGEQTIEYRKISMDYYAETWISDVEASIHHWSQRSMYLKTGIDLVEIRNFEEGACAICEPDVGKIFSLTGADPDFMRMDFAIPRHPHCQCYMVPVISDIGTLQAKDLPESI